MAHGLAVILSLKLITYNLKLLNLEAFSWEAGKPEGLEALIKTQSSQHPSFLAFQPYFLLVNF
jgi:hypothetical protein